MTSSSTPPPAAAGAPERHAPLRRLTARGRDEAHRVASPLELLFDLCFVVAIAQAGVDPLIYVNKHWINMRLAFSPAAGMKISAPDDKDKR